MARLENHDVDGDHGVNREKILAVTTPATAPADTASPITGAPSPVDMGSLGRHKALNQPMVSGDQEPWHSQDDAD